MCFSLEASIAMFVLGAFCTALAYKNINNNVALWLGYYTFMQAIHIVGYLTMNDCDNIYNRLASYANYTHISFQPLIQLIGYYGLMQFTGNIDNASRIRVNFALYLQLFIGFALFIRMFDFSIPGFSKKRQTKDNGSCVWCGKACSFKGKKHINFSLPLIYPNYLTPSVFLHTLGFFVIPFFINKFAALCSFIILITAYIPAYIHQIPGSEAGTIWCFISVLQAILVIFISLFYKK